ncbi:hypothetical protein GQ53DRAFT_879250 [Thozetella sp. PMI_491]|nr:hypothetical protein GQ53DRAFT_879250 [Thozetella sp. PMI_491]
MAAISEWSYPAVNLHPELVGGRLPPAHEPTLGASVGGSVQQLWVTHLPDNPGFVTPVETSQAQDRVDDRYRAHLLRRIQPEQFESFLPSTEFMNLCIRLFFERFNPIFPVIHSSTFRPQSENALLLLSICSLGSLFVGSAKAFRQGVVIFERLNKVVLATWESHIAREGRPATLLVQTALLGQTFGLLSGNPKYLILVEAFHGTVISWARKTKVFGLRNPIPDLNTLDDSTLESTWQAWIFAEERIRMLLGIFVHDSLLCGLFHHEPLLRHKPENVPSCASDDLFAAPTATKWKSLILRRIRLSSAQADPGVGQPVQSRFYGYAALAGIKASISEAGSSGALEEGSSQYYRDMLLGWIGAHGDSLVSDPFCLMILWHSAFISSYADVDLLEKAVGRDGYQEAAASTELMRAWASHENGQKCAMHALRVLHHVERLRINTEPTIHVPHNLFVAGLVLHCYNTYADASRASTALRQHADLPEFNSPSRGVSRHNENPWSAEGQPDIGPPTIYQLIDILKRIGHWELTRKYAAILEALVSDVPSVTGACGGY